MSATATRPRDYSSAAINRARILRANGVNCVEIADRLLVDFGRRPTPDTVSKWTRGLAPPRPEPGPEPPPVVPDFSIDVEPIPGEPQHDYARRVANARRTAIAELRRWMGRDRLRLKAVLLDPPEFIYGIAIIDVIRLGRGRRGVGSGLERLGRMAARDGVNLMLPIGRASTRTREWLAEHAPFPLRAGSVS